MKNDYCHVTFVLDRSGSMSGCWQETIESVRQFLRTQKELPGKMTFSLYTFNTGINRVCDFLDIQGLDVNGLSVDAPIGWTSLWDAAQYSINETGEKLAKLPEYERPSKVLMVYLTDGEENSSKYANVTKIRDMVEHQKTTYNWQFLFLGADFNTKEYAKNTGSQSFNYNKFDTKKIIARDFSNSVSKYRSAAVGASYDAGDIK